MANDNMSPERPGGKHGVDPRFSLPLPIGIEGEPRIRDLDLAARLGFAQERDIRKLIARHRGALCALGPIVERQEVVGKGQRVATAYLNRKQAIFMTARSDTPIATDITIEIVERFDAYEKGLLAAPATARINTAALNAVNDTVRELRRCQGPRAAAKALPSIYAMVGLTIEPHEHPQGELALAEKPEPTEDES
jgi:hypothetical protein